MAGAVPRLAELATVRPTPARQQPKRIELHAHRRVLAAQCLLRLLLIKLLDVFLIQFKGLLPMFLQAALIFILMCSMLRKTCPLCLVCHCLLKVIAGFEWSEKRSCRPCCSQIAVCRLNQLAQRFHSRIPGHCVGFCLLIREQPLDNIRVLVHGSCSVQRNVQRGGASCCGGAVFAGRGVLGPCL